MRLGYRSRAGHAIAHIGVLASTIAVLTLAACDGRGPVSPAGDGALQVTAQGRLERGAMVALSVSENGVTMPAASVSWSVASGASVHLLPPDSALLTDTGTASVTAHTHNGTATLTLRVAAPPTIVFDMHDVAGDGTLGDRSIYRAALDGRDLTRVAGGSSDNIQPTAAAGRIVFTSYRDGYPALYQVALAGGTDIRLTAVGGPAYQPALSAEGTELAFIATDSGDDKLWIAAGDGSGAIRATARFGSPSAEEAAPTWSPTGDRVAFVSTTLGDAALVSLRVSSDSAQLITSGTTTDVDPAWSPTGHELAFSSNRDGDLGIFVLTLATGDVRRVSPEPSTAGQPSWLSDGRIVYTSWTVNGGDVTSQVMWVDPTSPSVIHTVTTPAGDPEYARAAR
jgi:Tol biopolymer transport system component